MAFLQLNGISLAFHDRDILIEVNIQLSKASRAALTGANGSGKTTLMKIMAGLGEPDRGEITSSAGMRIAYLPQTGIVHTGRPLREEAEEGFAHLHAIAERVNELEHMLGRATDADSESKKTETIIAEHHELQERLLAASYYRREEAIVRILTGLGFAQTDLGKQTETFSGGWQMRIALAKMLLSEPDILLLDEPTNYLDLEAREWLEGYLSQFRGGVLLVSHDRSFLDATVQEVYELFQGSVKRYTGNYSEYEIKREQEIIRLTEAYRQQQEEILKLEDFIRRFRANASKATQVQSRVKQLEKIVRIEIPESLKPMKVQFPPPPHSGREILHLRDIEKSYGSHTVISGLELDLEKGEKLVIAGKNGAGKSTLMRILAGIDTAFSGEVKWGTGAAIAYFSQDFENSLDPARTVLEEIEYNAPTSLIPQLRSILGAFLFRGDDILKRVSVLSGGEKSRLALLKLLLRPANILILDEPTNHLDLASKDVLLTALRNFTGTVFFVSHDKDFIQALATKVLELSPQGARLFHGNYDYYRYRISQEAENEEDEKSAGTGTQTPSASQSAPGVSGVVAAGSAREDRERDKKRKSDIKRLAKIEAELLAKIEDEETRIQSLETALASSEVYTDGLKVRDTTRAIEEARNSIISLTHDWERVAEEIEAASQT